MDYATPRKEARNGPHTLEDASMIAYDALEAACIDISRWMPLGRVLRQDRSQLRISDAGLRTPLANVMIAGGKHLTTWSASWK